MTGQNKKHVVTSALCGTFNSPYKGVFIGIPGVLSGRVGSYDCLFRWPIPICHRNKQDCKLKMQNVKLALISLNNYFLLSTVAPSYRPYPDCPSLVVHLSLSPMICLFLIHPSCMQQNTGTPNITEKGFWYDLKSWNNIISAIRESKHWLLWVM